LKKKRYKFKILTIRAIQLINFILFFKLIQSDYELISFNSSNSLNINIGLYVLIFSLIWILTLYVLKKNKSLKFR
jgi:hypothetical protein